ncbi:hypothetical protein CTheo_8633 [Ceratobasidium theobromae]|uniref:DUF6532 domain-containing protein n=1 Tax=Ceratobasidium theobromae TaxID=1582974 RepID=A0A5N5Q878_9AGAM|nr:hypothetical protein CTheo_8633 [Ceratobasidium theobromae]
MKAVQDTPPELPLPGKKRKKTAKAQTIANPTTNPTATDEPKSKKARKKAAPSQATTAMDGVQLLPPPANLPSQNKSKSKLSKSKSTSKSKSKANAPEVSTPIPADIQPQPSETNTPDPSMEDGTVPERPKRHKTGSTVAVQAAEQEAAKQSAKQAKAQQKRNKAKLAPINESPEETQVFLERMKATPNGLIIPSTPFSSHWQPQPEPELSASVLTKSRCQEHHEQLLQRVVRKLADSSSQPPVSSSASDQSGTPITQLASPALLTPAGQPSTHSNTPFPTPSPILTTMLGSGTMDIIPNDIDQVAKVLEGLPPHLGPVITAPEPLLPPLHPPRCLEELQPVNLAGLSRKQHKAIVQSHKLHVCQLVDSDQIVVSAAISHLEALLITHNAFPTCTVSSVLASQANFWASQKFSVRLELKLDDEYEDLLLGHVSGIRAIMLGHAMCEVPLAYGFWSMGGDTASLEYNKNLVNNLLRDVNYTCPSMDHLSDLYEHPIFPLLCRLSFFANSGDCGPTHSDLWKTMTIPCLVFTATVVEKVLTDYSETGEMKKSDFTHKVFAPKYASHVATLKEMYLIDPRKLETYCHKTAMDLHKLHGSDLPTDQVVQPRISVLALSARYGTGKRPAAERTASPVVTHQASLYHAGPSNTSQVPNLVPRPISIHNDNSSPPDGGAKSSSEESESESESSGDGGDGAGVGVDGAGGTKSSSEDSSDDED